jgi:MYXO-CTERM domain-containing protein
MVACGALAASAQATTVATFADPAANGSTPLFHFDGATNTMTGGWNGLGLLLQTPGEPGYPDYSDARFTMTPLTVIGSFGPVLMMSAGQVNFFDSSNAPLLTVSFSGGYLNPTTSFGASDFTGFDVSFSGPILTGFTSSSEAFAFSFANLTLDPPTPSGGYTVTASFTSSADLTRVPTPGAGALLGLGVLAAFRRRR